MKQIVFLYMAGCPYCAQARRAIAELQAADPALAAADIAEIADGSEAAQPYAADYYYVPSMFVDGQKIYEAHPGESYEECRDMVAKVFAAARD